METGPRTNGRYHKHGYSHTRIDNIYRTMIARCHKVDFTNKNYLKYGAKGITVCDEWRNDKTKFFEWAFSHGYADNLTIDRIDATKGYSPENCRWATYQEQNNHRKSNHFETIDGETHTLTEWSRISGIKLSTINDRLYAGWSPKDAIFKPLKEI